MGEYKLTEEWVRRYDWSGSTVSSRPVGVLNPTSAFIPLHIGVFGTDTEKKLRHGMPSLSTYGIWDI
jgi:hypothetical protein